MSSMNRSAIDGLIGQANLKLAHGNSDEALALLHEAIRQDPRNAEVYFQVSNIYSDLDQLDECFKYRYLAANLSNKTSADEWGEVGMLALNLEKLDESAACYEKAIRLDPTNWSHYDKRIEVLEALNHTEMAMRTRLKAAQSINCHLSNVGFDWLKTLIKEVASYYITTDNEERAMDALEALVLRSQEFAQKAEEQHLTLIDMRLSRGRFDECVKSILTLQQGIQALDEQHQPALKTSWTGTSGCQIQPYPLPRISMWLVEDSVPTKFLSRLVICLLRLGISESATQLTDLLVKRTINPEEEDTVLEVASVYRETESAERAINFVKSLIDANRIQESPKSLYLLGTLYQLCDKVDEAKKAYEKVNKLQSDHVDSRINLSDIMQKAGKTDEALAVLKDCQLESCTHLPDERLLIRQADVLLESGSMSQYAVCVRLLLIPYFHIVHQQMSDANTSTRWRTKRNIAGALRKLVFQCLQRGPYRKMIQRFSAGLEDRRAELNGKRLHDYALKLAEILYLDGKFLEMFEVVSYAFLDSKISQTGSPTFKNLLFLAAIKTGNMALAFEFIRCHYSYIQNHQDEVASQSQNSRIVFNKRLFNAMNYVLCNYQNVAYHRFVIRALSKSPENSAMRIISGNNSLITGSYRHALGEFYRVWLDNRDEPLVCLLIALTFAHMACKKDISSRHMLAIRAIAFMRRYQNHRGMDVQEVNYNIGRLFHQLGILPKAIFFYDRVLNSPVPEFQEANDERYDLKRLAAYNLSLIYEASGNHALARSILESHCSV